MKHLPTLTVAVCILFVGWMCGFATYDLAPSELVRVSDWTPDWIAALGQWAGAVGGFVAVFFAAAAWRAAAGTLDLERKRDASSENLELRQVLAWNLGPTGVSGHMVNEGVDYPWMEFEVAVKNSGTAPLYDLRVALVRRDGSPDVNHVDVQMIDLLLPGEQEQLDMAWYGAAPKLGESVQTVSPEVTFSDVTGRRWTHCRGQLSERGLASERS